MDVIKINSKMQKKYKECQKLFRRLKMFHEVEAGVVSND